MPTLIFLAFAFQIQNIKWRYLFLILTAISFVFNIYHEMWTQEVYSVAIITLLFMLTPYFSRWWQKRNARSNPVSFWDLTKETYLLAKLNINKLLFWALFLILSIMGVCFYTGYTGQALLGGLLAVYVLIFGFKNLFSLILPPDWFLHDINTDYVFISVFVGYWLSDFISQKLGVYFILPMVLSAALCLTGFFLVRQNNRYLIPGCAIVLADIIWQLIRLSQDNSGYLSTLITTEVVLVVAMLIGFVWLIKKPGVMPIIYLALFQLFRFSGFTYEATNHAIADKLSVEETTAYGLYLVCWMYIVPLLFWMIGLRQLALNGNTSTVHSTARVNKFLMNLKKDS
jgi:hypothetical protein